MDYISEKMSESLSLVTRARRHVLLKMIVTTVKTQPLYNGGYTIKGVTFNQVNLVLRILHIPYFF